MKKSVIVIIIIILLSSLVISMSGDDFDDRQNEQNNAFTDRGDSSDNSDYDLGWYPLYDFEIEWCTQETKDDFTFTPEENNADYFNTYFGTSATLQFEKRELVDIYLYEFSGFVQPLDSDIEVYLQYYDEVENEWVEVNNATATQNDGYAFYIPVYLFEDIHRARIIYGGQTLLAQAVRG